MIDPFVLLTPILLLAVIALLRFVGCISLPPPPVLVTVTFDPPPTPTPGPFQGPFPSNAPVLDFPPAPNGWEWGPPDPTAPGSFNNIFFDSGTPTADQRSFSFHNGPRGLLSIRVFTKTAGNITLRDDVGQLFPAGGLPMQISPGAPQVLTVDWFQASMTVTISFDRGWDLGIDTITYSHSSSSPP